MNISASWHRINAIARRHAIVFRRSPHRWFDVLAPAVDSLLFGSLAVLLSRGEPAGSTTVPTVLTGLLLFHFLFASNLALSTGFLEETWSRSLLNLMVTPLGELEYLAGTALFGLSKVAIAIGIVIGTAAGFYAFDISPLALQLAPSAALLLLLGWVLALFVIGLVLRFGSGAEVLAWALAFLLWPLSGSFYPIDALPGPFQPIAHALPTTHAFASGRSVVAGHGVAWGQLGLAALGTAALAVAALAYLRHMLATFRRRGYITRYS